LNPESAQVPAALPPGARSELRFVAAKTKARKAWVGAISARSIVLLPSVFRAVIVAALKRGAALRHHRPTPEFLSGD